MENHINGHAGDSEHDQQLSLNTMMRNLWIMQEQLHQLNARISADEARARDEHIRAKAEHVRIAARFKNHNRCILNACAYRFHNAPYMQLFALLDLRTGINIQDFPATVGELSQLDDFAARNILDALEIPHEDLDAATVIEKLRFITFHAQIL